MTAPATLNALFFGALDRFGQRTALLRFRRDGRWHPIAAAELHERVRAASLGLSEIGVGRGERVALLSENRPEWAIADYACLTAGIVNVPIYPTLTAKQIEYLLRDSGSRAIFVSTRAQLDKINEVRGQLPDLGWVIGFDADLDGEGLIPLEVVEARGRAAADRHPDWKERALAIPPDSLATIIYTSGTTGEPKGVMLSHGNVASNVVAGTAVLPLSGDDETLSLLPLSHIFERMTGHFSMLHNGVTINYAESIESVPRDLVETRPTIVPAVPRLFEKIYAKALETAMAGSPIARRIFLWAKRVGADWATRRLAGEGIPLGLRIRHRLADELVFAKIRGRVGGRLKFFISGGAPLNAEIARFFYGAGLPILEGYGLTETSPVVAVNTPSALRIGTVGRPVPGVEVRIGEDGEVLVRGPNVMQGYYKKPDATAEAIDSDGWFHTGDVGEIDPDGFLRITDRIKDLIATAGGKKIAPQPIEDQLRHNPFIANAVMLGDRRKFPILLIAPDFERLAEWAKGQGLDLSTREELAASPEVARHLEAEAKKHFRDLAKFEVPKRFLVVPREFSIETGELTPKLSVRRRVVEQHYRDQIDAIYRDAEQDESS
ncbi:MAG: long-chain fatty acid--CoA ligase [Gemmatimonadales bacterium]